MPSFFRKRRPTEPASGVVLDPAGGVPAAVAAHARMSAGDWRSIEAEHGASADFDTRGEIAATLRDLDPVDDWLVAAPGSGLAHSVRGAQLTRLAWDVRGSGKASTVRPDAWGDFHGLLGLAEESLIRATELAPDDPFPWHQLIWTGMGLQVGVEETLARFAAMRERDDGYLRGWFAVTSAVALKWGGSHELMFDVARDGDRTLPDGSLGRGGLLQAHHERWLYLSHWEDDDEGAREYYTRPDVVAEIRAAATRSVLSPAHRPTASTRLAQSWFAYALAMIGDEDATQRIRAADLFAALGTDGLPTEPWQLRFGDDGAGATYARIRRLCYRAAGYPEPSPT